MIKLLAHKNVRLIFAAYLITYLGTAMAPIAMVFGVLELTGSAKDASYVLASMTVATILVLLLGGAIADRTSRKKVIIVAETVAMAIQGIVAMLFISGQVQVFWLMGLMFLNGIAIGLNSPATAGLITQLVDREELQSLNSVLGIARNTSMFGGAALGGVLVTLVGAGWTIAIDSVTFGASAMLMGFLKPETQKFSGKESIWSELKLGWKVFSSYRWIWVTVVQYAFVLAAFQAVVTVIGPVVSLNFYNGAASWGFIMAGLSVGLLAGGLIGMKYHPKYPLRVATFCVFSVAFIPLCLAGPFSVWVTVFAAVLNGVCWELFNIFWLSTLQKKIAPEYLSRVSAYDHIGSICLVPLGIVAAGYLYEIAGFRSVALIAVAIVVLVTFSVLLVRDIWGLLADESIE